MSNPHPPKKQPKWEEILLKQHESGLSANRWCIENSISVHTFHYWRKKLLPKNDLTRSCFTELVEENEAGVTIEYQGFSVLLNRQFDPSTLKRCLETLKEIKCS